MTETLNLQELVILLKAGTMFWAVPFHKTRKPKLSDQDEKQLEIIRSKLFEAKQRLQLGLTTDRGQEKCNETVELQLSSVDRGMLSKVLHSVLAECRDSDRNLEIHVGPRESVEFCLRRFTGT